MRYRLRTLLIVLALGPPLLAYLWLDTESVVLTACIAAALVFVIVTAKPLDLRQLTGNDQNSSRQE